jgi:hypothetical protein
MRTTTMIVTLVDRTLTATDLLFKESVEVKKKLKTEE